MTMSSRPVVQLTGALPDFMARGLCVGADPDDWYADTRTTADRERRAAAKAVCGRCRVVEECRAWSLAVREPYGVWGGLDEDERARIFARQARRERLAALEQRAAS